MALHTFWGEMHTHTFCGNSVFGDIEQASATAREHLDFWAPGEHLNLGGYDAPHPEFDWERITRVVKQAHLPGEFVTFPGFEIAGADGDFNAYFAADDPPQYLPDSLDGLFDYARRSGALLIPHHTGYKVGARGMDWTRHDPDLMPLMEVFSMHGSSERDDGPFPMDLGWMGPRATAGTALAGLMAGKRFGLIASSDGHNGYPGAYPLGLVAARAEAKTREAIWQALRARRTYAVTGDRVDLDFDVDGHGMGEAFPAAGPRRIAARVAGLDALSAVEIIKNGRVLHHRHPDADARRPDPEGPYCLRIGWGWGGAGCEVDWEADVAVTGGEIADAIPCFAPPGPNRIVERSPSAVAWTSHTSGYNEVWRTNRYRVDGSCWLVLRIAGDAGAGLRLRINGKTLQASVGDLLEGSRVELMDHAFRHKVKLYPAVPEARCCADIELDDQPDGPADWYYLRVTQANGQMAWSSPIWVES